MKNKFIIILVLSVAFSSCNKDFLDRQPLTEYSETTLWTGENDAIAACNAAYSNFEDGQWVVYMDDASDNAHDPYPWEGWQEFGNMQLLSPNNWSPKYNFTTITTCNWFLANIDKTPMDETLLKRLKGEVRFIRAYQYFERAQLFGDFPLITKMLTTTEANEVERTPKADVVQFILNELDTIATYLPTTYDASNLGRITQGAAYALKARVELFNEKYADAAISAKKVMDLGVYSLFPNYQDMFRMSNEHNSEIILDREYIESDPNLTIGLMVLAPESTPGGGWSSVNITQSLVDTYEMKNGKTIDDPTSGYDVDHPFVNRDPRLLQTIIIPGAEYAGIIFNPMDPNSLDYWPTYNYTGYVGRKYIHYKEDYSDLYKAGLNIPLIRYAEVLLTYAEAKIEADDIDNTVYDAIDQVRSRAGLPAVDQAKYATQAQLRELVRRERRVELALEGLRWYDIQRWKIGNEVMNGPVYGLRLSSIDANGNVTYTSTEHAKVEDRVFDPSKNYLWPIPQGQMDLAKKLTQNPNY
ncbi:MAG: RagB/SusD family nutrient uptake outer membrane protein [Agriterribacter sp.]